MKLLLGLLGAPAALAMCPYLAGNGGKAAHNPQWAVSALQHAEQATKGVARKTSADYGAYAAALAELDWKAVKADLLSFFTTSEARWPSDYGNYAPFMVRLAWHNSGSYRLSDGRGGSSGGRQRFEPERSWADNTNLDKARSLLAPLKQKYGLGLSWGDLFILAGTVAVESMGGPILGFCAGRIDAENGDEESIALGPSPEQMRNFPCGENNDQNGSCTKASGLGVNTVGLIYLNPEGPLGVPNPTITAPTIRDTFGRMAMNDSETVALIGGGHAFGKTHGACPTGAGPSPAEDPMRPWPGTCTNNTSVKGQATPSAMGVGSNAWTSGFEGSWTTTPTTWNNEYFKNLDNHAWEVYLGPGGHNQWRVADGGATPTTAGPQGGTQHIMMMTSDVSLKFDAEYKAIVHAWAQEQAPFDHAFQHAWYKLTSRDMGPHSRCAEATGIYALPAPEPWQHPLPAATPALANFETVVPVLRKLLTTANATVPMRPDTLPDGSVSYAAHLVRLAYHCAATFRSTDFQGGCNGARIRFAPQKEWPANAGFVDATLELLQPIKDAGDRGDFHGALSWADLIVLAGNVALEAAGGDKMIFCGGRTDDPDGAAFAPFAPNIEPTQFGPDPPGKLFYPDTPTQLNYLAERLGINTDELVALIGGVHTLGTMASAVNDPTLIPGNGTTAPSAAVWTTTPGRLSNDYFKQLLNNEWSCVSWPEGLSAADGEYWNCNRFETTKPVQVGDNTLAMLPTDLLLANSPGLASIALVLAENDASMFKAEFASVWTKVMNNDRFDGPVGNVCDPHKQQLRKQVQQYKCVKSQCVPRAGGMSKESCAAFCLE